MKRVEIESLTYSSVALKRTRECTEGSSDRSRTLLAYFDFEKYRSSVILVKDEIWAVRDEYGMPRKYVIVERDGDVNSALFRYLKYNRKVMYQRYKRGGILHSCGVFVHDLDPEPLDPPSYSHKVVGWGNKKSVTKYTIYPRKGEVWAISKYTHCMFEFASPSLLKYQMVEILEDYKLEEGVKVATLLKVKGPCQSLYQRHQCENAKVVFYIGSKGSSMDWFSHQVPYFRYSKENSFGGYLELDPSSLPLCIEGNFEGCEQDNVINDNILFLALLDKKVRYRKSDGPIWAAYEDQSRVPTKYVVGRPKIEVHSNKVKLVLHELAPCPMYAYEKKLVEARLPLVCGNFTISSTESKTNLMISHRVHFRNKESVLDTDHCYIQPVEGDVWGIYNELNMLRGQQIYESRMEYEIVVIVARGDVGTTVAKLVRVEGFRGLFRKKSGHGDQVQFTIPGNECYRFSHRIPSYQFDGRGKQFLKGAFILDPLLVPKNDGECFSFDDPFILERINSRPLWSIILYIVDKQRNGVSVDGNRNNNFTLKAVPNTSVVEKMVDIVKPNHRVEHEDTVHEDLNIKLHDFGDVISSLDFVTAQIWAIHNEIDGLPNTYVCISNVTDARVMVEVTLIEPHPITEEEMQWIEDKFMACGTFSMSQTTSVKHIGSFSHRVICDEVKPKDITFWNQDKTFYEIFPRKGEVWAIYNNWPQSHTRNDCKYKLVQVVSEFTKEAGVTVAALVRVNGYENVFKRQLHEDFGLYKSFNRKELLRFSHCIPSRQATVFSGCNSNEKPIEVKFSHIGI